MYVNVLVIERHIAIENIALTGRKADNNIDPNTTDHLENEQAKVVTLCVNHQNWSHQLIFLINYLLQPPEPTNHHHKNIMTTVELEADPPEQTPPPPLTQSSPPVPPEDEDTAERTPCPLCSRKFLSDRLVSWKEKTVFFAKTIVFRSQ